MRQLGMAAPAAAPAPIVSRQDREIVDAPMRPAGTEGWSEEKLADRLTLYTLVGA